MKTIEFQSCKELPSGYEYRFFEIDGKTKLVGIRSDKNPIVLELDNEDKLVIKEILPCL